MTDSFKARTTLRSGGKDLRHLELRGAARRQARAPALLAEDPAREPAALRRRHQRHARGHRGAARLGPEGRALLRNLVHARARDHAGLHRRALRRRPRRHARSRSRSSAAIRSKINPLDPGRAGHRSLGAGGRIRHAQALADNNRIEFERNGERYAFLRWGQTRVPQLQGRAAEHRHRAPGEPRVPRPRRVRRREGRHARRPIPTPWSAPTRTPR